MPAIAALPHTLVNGAVLFPIALSLLSELHQRSKRGHAKLAHGSHYHWQVLCIPALTKPVSCCSGLFVPGLPAGYSDPSTSPCIHNCTAPFTPFTPSASKPLWLPPQSANARQAQLVARSFFLDRLHSCRHAAEAGAAAGGWLLRHGCQAHLQDVTRFFGTLHKKWSPATAMLSSNRVSWTFVTHAG